MTIAHRQPSSFARGWRTLQPLAGHWWEALSDFSHRTHDVPSPFEGGLQVLHLGWRGGGMRRQCFLGELIRLTISYRVIALSAGRE